MHYWENGEENLGPNYLFISKAVIVSTSEQSQIPVEGDQYPRHCFQNTFIELLLFLNVLVAIIQLYKIEISAKWKMKTKM